MRLELRRSAAIDPKYHGNGCHRRIDEGKVFTLIVVIVMKADFSWLK